MKTKEGHIKSYRINQELLSAYVLMKALFISPKLYEQVDSEGGLFCESMRKGITKLVAGPNRF
jgi:hypothetical protein